MIQEYPLAKAQDLRERIVTENICIIWVHGVDIIEI